MSMSSAEVPPAGLHPPGAAAVPGADVAAGVRAQILATEHWSLLATRSMAWSEVMSRITIHLTVASASLVVLALMAQASGFGTAFFVMAIGLAAAVLVLGTLTAMRVSNASVDDSSLVIGMNRLRAAYLELDPALAPYLVTSAYDDERGLMDTYLMGYPRSRVSHVVASTSFFLNTFNAIVAGTLAALITYAAGGGPVLVAVLGVVGGLAYLVVHLELGRRYFGTIKLTSNFPTPTS